MRTSTLAWPLRSVLAGTHFAYVTGAAVVDDRTR